MGKIGKQAGSSIKRAGSSARSERVLAKRSRRRVSAYSATNNPVARVSRNIKPAPVPSWKLDQARRRRELLAAVGEEFGFLTSSDVHSLGMGQGSNPSANPSRWARSGKVIKLSTTSGDLYPGFQFDLVTGRPIPVMKELIEAWGPSDPAGLTLWLTAPNEWLRGDARPVDQLISDPDAVRMAMKHATEA